MKNLLAALCFELPALTADGRAPTTFTIVPAPGADGVLRGMDGRAWKLLNPEAVCNAWSRPRAITENHARLLAAPKGGSAPSFGWIMKIRPENGALVADVEWTDRGIAALNARDYRFFSPEFVYSETTGDIAEIVGGALTNDPNFPQLALNSEQHQEQSPMSLALILAALGLAPTATEADAVTAINSLKTEKLTALNAAQNPDPTKFALKAELDVALNRATTVEAQLAAINATSREADIVRVVDEAQSAGKVIPATREHYLAMCRMEGGLDTFKKLAEAMPVLGVASKTNGKPPASQGGPLTADEIAICANAGITEEQFQAARK